MLSEHKKENLQAYSERGEWGFLSLNRQAAPMGEARHKRAELGSLPEIIAGINRAVMDVYFVVQMGPRAGAR
jgi:hypothetical protein